VGLDPGIFIDFAQSQHLESIQKRAVHIIFSFARFTNFICRQFKLIKRQTR